jgi:hypothetical protein
MASKKEDRAAQSKRERRLKAVSILLAGGAMLLWAAVMIVRPYLPAGSSAGLVKGGPSLQVDKEVVDLGDVSFETPVGVTFQVTNVGDQPLRFTKAPFVEVLEGC